MLLELFIVLICLITYLHYHEKKQLPPGPFSVPFFGSLLSMPKGLNSGGILDTNFHKYGDMYTLFLGPTLTYVIINDLQLVKDLFSRDVFSGK